MSRSLLAILALCFLLSEPTTMNAQDRTYDGSALRLDVRFGDIRIVRGADGQVLGKVGVIGGADVTKIVAGSPQAVTEAREFQSNYGPGVATLGLGLVALGASVGVSHIHDVNRGITTGLTLATVGLITYGGQRLQRAYNALARSLWWYNRDLTR
jgi:hypothetical protein